VGVPKRSKNEASAPMFTARIHSRLRAARGRAVRGHTQVHRGVEIQECGRGRDTSERRQSMSTSGMKWPVALTDKLASVMLRPAETVTSAAFRERIGQSKAEE
jgi:hypothetical protein